MTADVAVHPAAGLFPMLGADALAALTADIRAHGLREPLVLDPDGSLLDGRNRLAACRAAGVEPTFRTHTGGDPVAFVLSENLHRRHLTTGQRAMLALSVEAMYAAQQMDRGGRPPKDAKPRANSPEVSEQERASAHKAGKRVGVGSNAVKKAKRLRAHAADLADRVSAGAMPLDRAARIQRDREAEQRRIDAAKEHPAPVAVRTELRRGDFRHVLADVTGVDAIITDPPYPYEYLPLLADLAAFADKALKPDGVLVVLMGQAHLPEVFRLLDGHRPYRWTGSYLTPRAAYVAHAARVHSNWKPLLVYGGGPRFADVVRAEGVDAQAKDLHHWGQDYGAFHTLIERFTHPGALVCDPFAGSGNTLLAARALGRHSIGAELDTEHHATAARRLA